MNMLKMSSEFRIAVRIYEYNIKKEFIWFSKLKESMIGDVSEQQLNSGLDRLHDLGIVSDAWEMIDDQWTKTYWISEDAKGLISSLARADEGQRDFSVPLPCPFCGCAIEIGPSCWGNTFAILHPDNDCILRGVESGLSYDTKEELIEVWNRRVA